MGHIDAGSAAHVAHVSDEIAVNNHITVLIKSASVSTRSPKGWAVTISFNTNSSIDKIAIDAFVENISSVCKLDTKYEYYFVLCVSINTK